jgi:MraZ protein
LVYPEPTWLEIERKLDQLPSFDEQARRLQRLYIGHAQEVDMDAQGRVLLPPALRRFASLDKHIALVGQGKKLELWDADTWNGNCDEWLTKADLSHLESSPEIASLNI